MKYLFIEYPKCSTCNKAKKWLENNKIEFEDRHIIEKTPTYEELDKWIRVNSNDIKKFFNTSGLVYRDLNLKEKLDNMTYEEKVELLSSNGMLIKRPLLIGNNFVLTGFKEKEWKEKLIK